MITSCLLHHVIVNCMLCGQNYIICITFLLTYSPCIHTLVQGHTRHIYGHTETRGHTHVHTHADTDTERHTKPHIAHTCIFTHIHTHYTKIHYTTRTTHNTHTLHYTTRTTYNTHMHTHTRTHTHTHTHTLHMHTRAHTIYNTM